MPTDTLVQRSDLIATPTAVVALMVVLLLVLWVAAHALGRRFLGQFPRNAMGKVVKPKLREMLGQAQEAL